MSNAQIVGPAFRRLMHVLAACAMFALGFGAPLAAQDRPQVSARFQVGDRILLKVTGEAELTDTFTVIPGPSVTLPVVGNVSLAGVRRDTVERVLKVAIEKFFRDPVVHARALVRVAVLGEVMRPGFYSVPSDMFLSDVLMAAGGPTPTAKLDGLHVMRSGVELISVDSTKKSLAEGLTLTQVGIASDDQFFVPKAADPERTIRLISALIAIPIAVITILLVRR